MAQLIKSRSSKMLVPISQSDKERKRDSLITKGEAKQMIKSLLVRDVEDKYNDVNAGAFGSIDDTGLITGSLTDVVQGITDTNRVGDTILAKRLSWSVFCRYNITNTTTNLAASMNTFRFLIFAWKPFFADVAPTVTKVMMYNLTSYAAAGPIVHDGRGQFILLHDETFCLDGFSKASKVLKGSVKLNHVIQFKNASTTNGAGKIFALYMSDAVTGTGPYPAVISSSYRLDFVDS